MTQRRSTTTSTDEEAGSTANGPPAERAAEQRERMVATQLRDRGIHDERVLKAMSEVPRELFLLPDQRHDAYRDGAVYIGEGQTMSQPWIVACMTELLELEGDERVLEVGTGSGYAAAVLGRCASQVITIERHPVLAERARQTLAELGYDNVEVRVGDGSGGAPDRAPFGGISVTAAVDVEPPSVLVEQLEPGAALVCPVRRWVSEELMRYRHGRAEPVVPVRFVPLVRDVEDPAETGEPHDEA